MVEFGLLGQLSVKATEGPVVVGAGRHRSVLAALLVHANATVGVADLADMVWNGNPPPRARATLQSYLMRLRRVLGTDLGGRVVTKPGGYQIEVADGELDVRAFEKLFRAGSASIAGGEWERGAAEMRAALDLWRGEALADIPSDYLLRTEGARLGEMRVQALEWRIQADLRCGRHDGVVAELRRLVTEFPFRERLWESLLLALYRSGQQAAALAAYQQVRRVLVEQLAVEPGTELRQLHQRILAADPELLAAGAGDRGPRHAGPGRGTMDRAAPCTLPADIADFTGRAVQAAAVRRHLQAADGTAVPVAVITGQPGAGKSALAVHVAHGLRDGFPDGQLYLNLGGCRARPLRPEDALAQLLAALGADPASLPGGLDERANVFRGLVADRRVLVLLDDAVGREQVMPLLPGRPGCGVIVTSRARLTDMSASHLVELGEFPDGEAHDLLARVAGNERVKVEPAAAAELIRLCGALPLAVRILAARLAARPHWSLAELTARMSGDRGRLNELTFGPLDIRSGLTASYQGVSSPAGRLFRLLGMLDAAHFPAWVGAALLGISEPDAEELIEELVAARLLHVHSSDAAGRIRYRFPELARVYARERAQADEPAGELAAQLQHLAVEQASLAGASAGRTQPAR